MKIVAIIQARLGSTRLPGKVLAEIGGRSMLARVCDRVGRAARVDQVVVATTPEPVDRPIVDECERLSVRCFRGSPEDVLDRYQQAAVACRAEVVVQRLSVPSDIRRGTPFDMRVVVNNTTEPTAGGSGTVF